jgi:hypothetical protein
MMETGLPPKTDQKVRTLRALLQKTVTKKDPLTGKMLETTEPTEVKKIYDAKKAAYVEARREFEAHRIAALAAADPGVVHDWAANAHTYNAKAQSAMSDWVTNGYKQEVEMISAFISQLERHQNGDVSIDSLVERTTQIERELAAKKC